jgi:hypothetical protein
MRATLSPAFTGSKMKLMMPFMTDISKNIVEDLKSMYLNVCLVTFLSKILYNIHTRTYIVIPCTLDPRWGRDVFNIPPKHLNFIKMT